MSAVISMPGMRKRLDLIHWAKNKGIFSENDGYITCKCAKCVHPSTTKPLQINMTYNKNVENTCFQHLWGSGNVQLTKDGNPFIDMTKKWCPHHHWHRDVYEHLCHSDSTGKCYISQERMEKAEASLVQMPVEGSHSSLGAAVVPASTSDAKKPTYLVVATRHPDAVTGGDAVTVDKDLSDGRKAEDSDGGHVAVDEASIAPDGSKPEDAAKYPIMHFGPIITNDQCADGQITSEVNFIPMYCETEDGIYPITPCDTLDYYYTSAVTPYVEDTHTWYCPCVVYEAANGGMKKKISYTPKIRMDPDGSHYKYI